MPAALTALAGITSNLVTAGDSYVISLFNDSGEIAYGGTNPYVNITGFTTDATHNITIEAAAGQGWCNNGAVPLRYDATNGVAFRGIDHRAPGIQCDVPYTVFDGLQVTAASNGIVFNSAGGTVKNCLVSIWRGGPGMSMGPSSGGAAYNNVLIGAPPSSFGSVGLVIGRNATSGLAISHNTVVYVSDYTASAKGIDNFYGQPAVLTNNAFFNFSSFDSGTSNSFCATDLGSLAGSNNLTSVSYASAFISTLLATADFRLQAGSALVAAGTSGTGITVDVFGTARDPTTPCIGAFEYSSPGWVLSSNPRKPTVATYATVVDAPPSATAFWQGQPGAAGSRSALSARCVAASLGGAYDLDTSLAWPQPSAVAFASLRKQSVSINLSTGNAITAVTRKASTAITAELDESGTLSASLRKPSTSLAALQSEAGTIAPSLRKPSTSIAAVEKWSATVSASLRKPSSSITSVENWTATASASLRKPATSFAALQSESGTLSVALRKPASAIAALQSESGTIALALRKSSASITGAQAGSSTITLLLRKPSTALSLLQNEAGSIALALRKPSTALSLLQNEAGSIALALRKPGLAIQALYADPGAVVSDISATPRKPSASIALTQGVSGSVSATTHRAVASVNAVYSAPGGVSGAVASSLRKPSAAVSGTAGLSSVSGSLAARPRKPSAAVTALQAESGTVSAALRKPRAAVTVRQDESGAIRASIRKPTTRINGAGVATVIVVTGALRKPSVEVYSTVVQAITVRATLRKPNTSLAAQQNEAGTIASRLRKPSVTLTSAFRTAHAVLFAILPDAREIRIGPDEYRQIRIAATKVR